MIKANELRIGNLIQDIKYKSPWKIICFYGESIVNVDAGLVNFPTDDQYQPSIDTMEYIPLTEEWLLKFGFEKSETYDFGIYLDRVPKFTKGIIKIALSKGVYCYYVEEFDGGSSFENIEVIEVKYVHQLQNLYFALTGEELLAENLL